MNKLKYKGYAIVFQEVPNEITLAINICGCPHKCKGCHSQYLWLDDGDILEKDLNDIINKYKDYITCVCFMGGDQNLDNLNYLKTMVEQYSLKTAIYSGSNSVEVFNKLKEMRFSYIKIGSYEEDKGGLDSKITNQKMYKLNEKYDDITSVFQKDYN